jgi:hypothetical protein
VPLPPDPEIAIHARYKPLARRRVEAGLNREGNQRHCGAGEDHPQRRLNVIRGCENQKWFL